MRKLVVATGALAILLTATACGGGSTTESQSASGGGPLTIANSVTMTPWDLAQSGAGDVIQYYEPVYDSLVRLGTDGSINPNLATSWSYDQTNTVLTLKLRDDVKFTDGTKLDAEAVKENLLHTKSGSNETSSRLTQVADVAAPDATTAVITLSSPNPALLTSLGDTSGMIASPTNLEATNGPVGSGPYVLDTANTTNGTQYAYKRNPDYWNAKAFPFETIVIKTLIDETARLNAVLSGQVDWAKVPAKQAQQVKDRGLTVTTNPEGVEGVYIWDRGGTIVPALGDVKVRQADPTGPSIARRSHPRSTMAIPAPTSQMFRSGFSGHDPALDGTYGYDVQKAKQLIAEAGYPDGFSVTAPDLSGVAPDAQAVMVQSLADIGITVNLEKVPFSELFGDIQSGKWPLSWFKLSNPHPWTLITSQVAPTAIWNGFHYEDPKIQDLSAQIQAAPADQQEPLYQQLNKYLQDTAFNAPWGVLQAAYANSAGITSTPASGEASTPIYYMAPAGS